MDHHDPMCKPLQHWTGVSGSASDSVIAYSDRQSFEMFDPRTCICAIIKDIRDDTLKNAVVLDKYTDSAYIYLKSREELSQKQYEVDAILDIAEDGSVVGVEVLEWPQKSST